MSALDQYTRWDKTRSKSITVHHQHRPSSTLRCEREFLGFDVITRNPMVAEMFGVEVVDNEEDSIFQTTILDAEKTGNYVFYLEFGEHSMYWCKLCDERPNECWDGVIIVRKEAWQAALQGTSFARSFVSGFLHGILDASMTAELNCWFYEACITDSKNDDSYWISDFLDPDHALSEAMTRCPDICYSEDDFEPVVL